MSVYLDHAATTPMFDVAIEAMNASLRKLGNPSSLHTEGRSTRKDVEDAREKLAKAIDCLPSEVIFTGSGTEANNAAIKGLYWQARRLSLSPVLNITQFLIRRTGWSITKALN